MERYSVGPRRGPRASHCAGGRGGLSRTSFPRDCRYRRDCVLYADDDDDDDVELGEANTSRDVRKCKVTLGFLHEIMDAVINENFYLVNRESFN